MPTGWDAADAPDEMRNFADGVETINFPKVIQIQNLNHFLLI